VNGVDRKIFYGVASIYIFFWAQNPGYPFQSFDEKSKGFPLLSGAHGANNIGHFFLNIFLQK
jgi:hypothetical protein